MAALVQQKLCTDPFSGHDLHEAARVAKRPEGSSLADEALRRIGGLYAIEGDIRGRPAEFRRAQRQARAGPRLTAPGIGWNKPICGSHARHRWR